MSCTCDSITITDWQQHGREHREQEGKYELAIAGENKVVQLKPLLLRVWHFKFTDNFKKNSLQKIM